MESPAVAPLSPEPPAAAVRTTAEVIADTLDADLLGMGAFAGFADNTQMSATQTSARFVRNNTMANANISLEQLFGRGLAAILSDTDKAAHDPALLDTEAILQAVFGQQINFVHDAFTVAPATVSNRYQQAIQDARMADSMSELDVCFGAQAEYVKHAAGVSIRPNVTMSAAYPTRDTNGLMKPNTDVKDKMAPLVNSTLLLTMPTVYPNRQILHFDTIPYNPMTTRPKESNDRKTYTPQNIIMWTYDKKSGQFLSNARVIQWSDGSTTLHVGAESYDIETYTDGALTFLGERRHMYRCDKAYSAIVETVPVDNHVTVRSRSDKQNSIDFVTATKTAKSMAENAALSIGLPLTGLPAFVGNDGRKSVEEEYVDSERKALKKLIADLERQGTPMTLAEQMRRDAQILNDVINVGKGIESLVAKQNERKAAEEAEKEAARAEREVNNQSKLGSKRIRLVTGVDGVTEKKSRTERRTDRRPNAEFYADGEGAAELQEAAREEAAIDGEKWRDALRVRLEEVLAASFDDEAKTLVTGTIESLDMLSRRTCVAELRKFVTEVEHESSIAEPLGDLEALIDRLEAEDKEGEL